MRIPVSLPARWLGSAASSLDRAAARAAAWSTHRSAPRIGSLSHTDRLSGLARLTAAYDDPRFLASPELFFEAAPPARPACVRVRDLGARGGVFDATWPSGHVPLFEDVRSTYGAHTNNQTVHARLFLGPEPRPAVIVIHGYLGGQYRFEERSFPIRWMTRRGFDVAAIVLPFHALRARTDRAGAPLFPGADPRFTIEGCRQACTISARSWGSCARVAPPPSASWG